MITHNVEQNTPEWLAARSGKFTASMFGDLFAAKTTQAYENAIYRVAFERVTGQQAPTYSNVYMERGHELESTAREAYEMQTFNMVEQVGFCELNDWVGCSPDGLIGTDGMIEIKCPAYNTFIRYINSGKLPSTYFYQVHGQMYVTGRQWVDFTAYHPPFKPFIIRVERDEKVCQEIETALTEAIEKAKKIIEKLTKYQTI